jgi:WhiB family redox-sensing transcriptional regulator
MTANESTLLPRWSQQNWMAEAACRGRTELFFPPAGERPQARVRREAEARKLCEGCPVEGICRGYARVHREHGFWGGESEDERILAGYVPPHAIGIARLRRAG